MFLFGHVSLQGSNYFLMALHPALGCYTKVSEPHDGLYLCGRVSNAEAAPPSHLDIVHVIRLLF